MSGLVQRFTNPDRSTLSVEPGAQVLLYDGDDSEIFPMMDRMHRYGAIAPAEALDWSQFGGVVMSQEPIDVDALLQAWIAVHPAMATVFQQRMSTAAHFDHKPTPAAALFALVVAKRNPKSEDRA